MTDPKEPREFSCTDDSPTNTGTFGQDRDWDEVRPRSLRFNTDEIDDDETDFEGSHYEGDL